MGNPPWERHQGVKKERERARSWEMKSSRNFGEEADSFHRLHLCSSSS